jgi:4-hydroxybenzoate polyprenyltransferase
MGAGHSRLVTRRPRWRAWLLLARVSNLPTVWSNVLAGTVMSGAVVDWPRAAAVAAGVSLLYMGGMFLNDACDHRVDARVRPERPIPSGDVPLAEAVAIGALLLVGGEIAVALASGRIGVLRWSGPLALAILYYDVRHKRDPFGPVVMGICRGLVYCTAAAAAADAVDSLVVVAAAGMTVYVAGLTLVAKRLGPRAGTVVPVLIAGISLVDAVAVATRAPALAPVAAMGFVLTLVGQRVVPGD